MNTHTASSPFLIRPEQVAAIRSLSLRARLIVEGMIAGLHRSPYHGFSVEFSEYRPYHPGESTRYIDWRQFAKTDRSVVRLFEDETNLFAHLLLDKSASMEFSSGAVSKFEYARTLCAALAWVLIQQRDAVGFAAFDESVEGFVPPRSTNRQLSTILAQLQAQQPAATTRCGVAFDWLGTVVKRRGLCIIFSDLLDDIDAIVTGLRHLRFKQQDIIMVRVLDPMELHFEGSAPFRLIDLESDQRLELDGAVASEAYAVQFGQHRAALDAACRDAGAQLHYVTTDEPFQKALFSIIKQRKRLP